MMLPLPPGWLCLQDCNLSGQLSQPVVVPFVLMHPDVGVALIDVAPIANPDAESVLRRRLEAARFESIFPGFLPILHLRLDRADLPSTETILRDAFAALPPLSVPGGDGWVSVVRRALLPRDPGRAARASRRPPRPPGERAPRPSAEPAGQRRRIGHAPPRGVGPVDAESRLRASSAGSALVPLPWVIMSGVGGLIAVLAIVGLLNPAPTRANSVARGARPAPRR